MSRNSSSARRYDPYDYDYDLYGQNGYDYNGYPADDYGVPEAYQAYIEQAKVSQAKRSKTKKTRNARRRHIQRTLSIKYVRGFLYVVAYGIIMVFLCAQSSMMSYDIVKLQAEIGELETENKRLAFAIQEKSSLDRIAEIAETELGMVKPDMSQVYVTENIVPAQIVMPKETVEADNRTALEKLYDYLKELAGKAFETGVDFLASY